MVGYALSAASDEGYENILITVIDAEDFAFVGEGADVAVYRYSRRLRVAERVDKESVSDETVPYKIIYDVASLLKTEEIKWRFPMALVWSYPEFGELELVSAEFQKTWPAVMFLANGMESAYANITDAFFGNGVCPLYASFLCDVLNTVMFSIGVYIPDGFCSCFNSVFCDIRIFDVEKLLFKENYLGLLISKSRMPDIPKSDYKKIKVTRRTALKALEKYAKAEIDDFSQEDIRSTLILLKKGCVNDCLRTIHKYLKGHRDIKGMYDELNMYISGALEGIVALRSRLSDEYIISEQADIYYMTFDDLLSALTFADERMDLKSVIRIVRQKNKIARDNPPPAVVLTDGRIVRENI